MPSTAPDVDPFELTPADAGVAPRVAEQEMMGIGAGGLDPGVVEPPSPAIWARRGRRAATFLTGQLALQALLAVAGLLALRWMPIEQYARFGLAFAFQSVASSVVDCGFSNTIVALVGERRNDPDVIGGYLRSAKHYRNRLFCGILPVAAVVFFVLGRHHAWPAGELAMMFAGIGLTIWLQGSMIHQSVLVMHGQLHRLYAGQILATLSRIGALLALHLTGMLNAVTAVWLATLAYAVTASAYRRAARPFVTDVRLADPKRNEECRRIALPQVPGILFFAVQGNVTTAMAAIFGSTRTLAEVAAMGRLGQVFSMLNASNSIFVEPYVANAPAHSARRRCLLVLACVVPLCAGILTTAWLAPSLFLLLLGSNYADRRAEVVIAVAAGVFGYAQHATWVMNVARRVFGYWASVTQILAVLIAQATCLAVFDVGTTHGALMLNAGAAGASLFAQLFALRKVLLRSRGVALSRFQS